MNFLIIIFCIPKTVFIWILPYFLRKKFNFLYLKKYSDFQLFLVVIYLHKRLPKKAKQYVKWTLRNRGASNRNFYRGIAQYIIFGEQVCMPIFVFNQACTTNQIKIVLERVSLSRLQKIELLERFYDLAKVKIFRESDRDFFLEYARDYMELEEQYSVFEKERKGIKERIAMITSPCDD